MVRLRSSRPFKILGQNVQNRVSKQENTIKSRVDWSSGVVGSLRTAKVAAPSLPILLDFLIRGTPNDGVEGFCTMFLSRTSTRR